jgi:hypothetical protein
MPQTVWHKHEIESVLRGVELACQQLATQYPDGEIEGYRQGFLAALAATATSFGIRVNNAHVRPNPSVTVHLPQRLDRPES